MNIAQIGSYFKYGCGVKSQRNIVQKGFSGSPFLKPLCADVVSFSGKTYDSSSIKSPTGHCAYCGAKVYSDGQLEGLAKELLQLKGDKLQGKIRSINEKLGLIPTDNALIARKASVNEDNIEFFKKFSEYSSKNTRLSGREILKKFYNLTVNEDVKILCEQLHPLLGTIDHVVPQKHGVNNDNSDMNLVETCYTCNSKIKNGTSFQSFYLMYPSVKDTMPKDKFEFASLELLQKAPSIVESGLQIDEIMQVFTSLREQQDAAKTNLYSLSNKIANCAESMNMAITRIQSEQQEKRNEIAVLRQEDKLHSQDSEYRAIQKRKLLESEVSDLKKRVDELTTIAVKQERVFKNYESKLQEYDSKTGHNKKIKNRQGSQKGEMSREEILKRKTESAAASKDARHNLERMQQLLSQREEALKSLDAENLDIEKLRARKNRIESLLSLQEQIKSSKSKFEEAKQNISSLEAQVEDLKRQESELSLIVVDTSCSQESDKEALRKYKLYMASLRLIEASPKDKETEQCVINNYARAPLEAATKELEKNPLVKLFINQQLLSGVRMQLSLVGSSIKNAYTQKNYAEAQVALLSANFEKILQEESSETSREGEKNLSLFSMHDIDKKLQFLNAQEEKLIEELANIPEDRSEDNDFSSSDYRQYSMLMEEIKATRLALKKSGSDEEKAALQDKLNKLNDSKAESYESIVILRSETMQKYEKLLQHQVHLQDELVGAQTNKEKNDIQSQLESIEQEIEDLYNNDAGVFNKANAKKRIELSNRIEKTKNTIAELEQQKRMLEAHMQKTDSITGRFSSDAAKKEILTIETDIKRLNEKSLWLDVAERIKKIEAEISFMDKNISTIRNQLASISSAN